MVEKIKDLLYDLTDFVLVIIIVAIMFSVLSLKITDSLSINVLNVFHKDNNTESVVINDSNNTIDNKENLEDIAIKPENNDSITNDEISENNEINMTEDENTSVDETANVDDDTNIPNSSENTQIIINIESGSTGYKIAKILKDNNLIEDTSVFISRVEELNLGAKLRSGSFTLNTSQSLDDMIYIIAGKK